MSGPHFPQGVHIVMGAAPIVGAAGAVVGDYISCKNALKVWCCVLYNQADGNAITFGVNQATDVAPTGAAALVATMPVFSNLDTGTSDLMVRRADAATYAAGAGATDKIVVFEVDPAILTAGFDCIAVRSDTAIAAAQYVAYFYVIEPRYGGNMIAATTYITD